MSVDTPSNSSQQAGVYSATAQTWGKSSSLLASLWSPLSSLSQKTYTPSQDLGSSTQQSAAQDQDQVDGRAISNQSDTNIAREEENRQGTESNQTQNQNQTQEETKSKSTHHPSPSQPESNSNSVGSPNSEAVYCTPTYKRLQKLRLSGTRTKQLIRAASRAHDDPPPPPELGACCGSSCDPCVNDLWREERDVWRERWGDYAVESVEEKGRSLEW